MLWVWFLGNQPIVIWLNHCVSVMKNVKFNKKNKQLNSVDSDSDGLMTLHFTLFILSYVKLHRTGVLFKCLVEKSGFILVCFVIR